MRGGPAGMDASRTVTFVLEKSAPWIVWVRVTGRAVAGQPAGDRWPVLDMLDRNLQAGHQPTLAHAGADPPCLPGSQPSAGPLRTPRDSRAGVVLLGDDATRTVPTCSRRTRRHSAAVYGDRHPGPDASECHAVELATSASTRGNVVR